ncbi:hypothetical protein FHX44_111866 [Pseudonocardia hierapolitana]|uniref:Uncharacterized protein n=2 Tax=Pseudonocardia hierapolitana TaxID=1128676 RepID=A0A561SM86_9PSEU|nr:hypothetical protein FHX44_111866 [Pseudonocardia hierapolitana]
MGHEPIDVESLPSSPLPSQPLAIALQKAVALLESLSREQLEAIASGAGKLVYQPATAPTPAPTVRRREAVQRPSGVDIEAAVADINRFATPGEVSDYLQKRGVEFTVPVLKEIARALGPTVNSTGRTKTQLRRDIIEGTAGFRVRSAAMSGGAWSKP